MLRLLKYEFEFHYIKGSLLTVADTLSRASLADKKPEIGDEEMSYYILFYLLNLLVLLN